MGKTRPSDNPYEVWKAGDWTWKVLKFNQGDRTKPFATAFCEVSSPYTHGGVDMGDTYIADFERVATLVETNYPEGVPSPLDGDTPEFSDPLAEAAYHGRALTDIPDEDLFS
jgi:hypothetical protein